MGYTPVRPGLLCGLDNTILFAASMCSTLFIVSMTFERFYSIIRPHKAASVNTVKRAKITIVCILVLSALYNIPHTFITLKIGRQCIPYGNALDHILGQIYYYLSLVKSFFLPFIMLLIMNSFIIHTIRKRSDLIAMKLDSEAYNIKGQGKKMKNSEKQIFITLLFVTFAFLILNTPAYGLFLYVMIYDYEQTPKSFAGYTLFESIGRNMYFTNYAINFALYVISGKKFRSDLVGLFKSYRERDAQTFSLISSSNTIIHVGLVPKKRNLIFLRFSLLNSQLYVGYIAEEKMKRIINLRWWHLFSDHTWVGPIAIALIFPQLTLESLVFTIL